MYIEIYSLVKWYTQQDFLDINVLAKHLDYNILPVALFTFSKSLY